MAMPPITINYSMGYAPARPVQPQNRMHACDFHAAGGTDSFTDPLDSLNSTLWSRSDGWTNGMPFDCGWKADHVSFTGGEMVLTLDNTPSSGKPYSSSEYRSNDLYGYGTVEASIKAAKADGVMGGSLFICTGPWDNDNPRDEIDIEFVKGKMQVNYYTNGVGGHETLIDLGFDPSSSFHTYKIEWLPDRINWYVDGAIVHTENGSRGALPRTPGRIMANLWPGDVSVDGWLGHFNYTSPLTVEYDWIKYTPLSTQSVPTIPTIPTITADKPIMACPNPCKAGNNWDSGTWIKWPDNHYSRVEVRIYTIYGALVKTLVQNDPIHYSIKWDSKNENGTVVAPGLYAYAVLADGRKIGSGKLGVN